jgi:hypothetical protein
VNPRSVSDGCEDAAKFLAIGKTEGNNEEKSNQENSAEAERNSTKKKGRNGVPALENSEIPDADWGR